jgi:hypothetical protein
MLETRFGQQLDEEFLGQIGVSAGSPFLDQQSRTARRSHQRMVADDAVKFGPKTIYV